MTRYLPALTKGDRIGKLTVLEYMGRYHPMSSKTGKPYKWPAHHYKVQCECGTVETKQQCILTGKYRRETCVKCGIKSGHKAIRSNRKKPFEAKRDPFSWPVPPSVLAKTMGTGL